MPEDIGLTALVMAADKGVTTDVAAADPSPGTSGPDVRTEAMRGPWDVYWRSWRMLTAAMGRGLRRIGRFD